MSNNVTVTGNPAQFNEDVVFLKDANVQGTLNSANTSNLGQASAVNLNVTEQTNLNRLYVTGVTTFMDVVNFNQELSYEKLEIRDRLNVGIGGTVLTANSLLNPGKVGIGSTQPSELLDVFGRAKILDLELRNLLVTGISTFQDDIFIGTGATVGFGSTAYFRDDAHLIFGDDQDLKIFSHNGNGYVETYGTSNLNLRTKAGTQISLRAALGAFGEPDDEVLANFIPNSKVELFFDGEEKFETSQQGFTGLGTGYITNALGIGTPSPSYSFQAGIGGNSVIIDSGSGVTTSRLAIGLTTPTGISNDGVVGFGSLVDDNANGPLRLAVDGSIAIGRNIYDSAGSVGENGYWLKRNATGVRWVAVTPSNQQGIIIQDEGVDIPITGTAQTFSQINFVQKNSLGLGTDTLVPTAQNPTSPTGLATITTFDLWGYQTPQIGSNTPIYRMTRVGIGTANPRSILGIGGTSDTTTWDSALNSTYTYTPRPQEIDLTNNASGTDIWTGIFFNAGNTGSANDQDSDRRNSTARIGAIRRGDYQTDFAISVRNANALNEVLRLTNDRKVGINSSNPDADLSVYRPFATGPANISLVEGSLANNRLDLFVSPGIGTLGIVGENSLSFNTNNLSRIYVTGIGSVGVGLTTPLGKFHVKGDILALSETGDNQLILGTEANANKSLKFEYDETSDRLNIKDYGADEKTTHVTIDNTNSRVGIGSIEPSKLLDLSAANPTINVKATGGNDASLELIETSGANFGEANAAGFRLRYDGGDDKLFITSGNDTTTNNRVSIIRDTGLVGINEDNPTYRLTVNSGADEIGIGVISTDPGSYLSFEDDTTGSSKIYAGALGGDFLLYTDGTERIRVENGGDVGIGTIDPNYLLDVYTSSSATNKDLFAVRTKTGALLVQASDTDVANPEWRLRTFASEDLVFSPGNTEKVKIEAVTGNVGIGSSSPKAKLDVNGDTHLDALDVTGIATFTGSWVDFNTVGKGTTVGFGSTAYFKDSAAAVFGDNENLKIYFDGNSVIKDSGVGDLYIMNGNKVSTKYVTDGSAEIYYNNLLRLKTIEKGFIGFGTAYITDEVGIGISIPRATLDVNGSLNVSGISTLNDDVKFVGSGSSHLNWDKSEDKLKFDTYVKATFGTNDDLKIYHSGQHSFIDDTGTGNLKIRSNNIRLSNVDETKISATFQPASAVTLHYNNDQKFTTQNTGIDVTGLTNTDTLNVDGHSELDNVNVSGVSTFVGISTFKDQVGIAKTLSLGSHIRDVNNDIGVGVAQTDWRLTSVGAGVSWRPSGVRTKRTIWVTKNGSDTNSGLLEGDAKATIGAAASIAQESDTIKIRPGLYYENNPVGLRTDVSITGEDLRLVTVIPNNPTKDVFQVRNGCLVENLNFVGKSQYTSHKGAGAVAFPPPAGVDSAVTGYLQPGPFVVPVGKRYKSPYVRNCTNFMCESTGMKIDGNNATAASFGSDLKSMVCDSFTQYNENGIGVSITNDGYAQLVSIFTINSDIGIYCSSGGQCDLTNSNSSFGNFGLVAVGLGTTQFSGIVSNTDPANNFIDSTNPEEQDTVTCANVRDYGGNARRPFDGQALFFTINLDNYPDVASSGILSTPLRSIESIKLNTGVNLSGFSAIDPPSVIIRDADGTLLPKGPQGIIAEASATVSPTGTITGIDVVATGRNYLPSQNLVVDIEGNTGLATAITQPIYYTIDSATVPTNVGLCTLTFNEFIPYELFPNDGFSLKRISRILTSSHSFEYVGTGTDINTSTPLQGAIPIKENEIVASDGAQIPFTSTDQKGNFDIGEGIQINQTTSTITGRDFSRAIQAEVTPLILALR